MRAIPLCLALCLVLLPRLLRGQAREAEDRTPEPCVASAIEAVQRRYEGLSDLRASFVQTTRSVALGASGGGASESRGTVVFAKPGKMRWSYEKPEPSLVVSDGKWLWVYEPAQAEAQRLPVRDEYLSGAAIQFLLGEGDLLQEFHLIAADCSPGGVQLDLGPRRPTTYEKLRVVTDPSSGDLLQTEIVDLFGNVTTVAFSHIEANSAPGEEQFRFEPPEGVRVIELEPQPATAP